METKFNSDQISKKRNQHACSLENLNFLRDKNIQQNEFIQAKEIILMTYFGSQKSQIL